VDLPAPGPNEVGVRTLCSAISAGTERLAYRGELDGATPRDVALPALGGDFTHPFAYGYAAVGEVDAVGPGVDPSWAGRRVFGFVPHASAFVARAEDLLALPTDMAPERAAFVATGETAVSLVHDGAPLLGERVAVVGLGAVGVFVAALAQRFPLGRCAVFDPRPGRRALGLELGVDTALSPDVGPVAARGALGGDGADLVFEVSGTAAGMELAIELCGFDGRVVVGSWLGDHPVPVRLGTRFHRERLRLVSSQVSRLGPGLSGRWSGQRRLETVLGLLDDVAPERWVTHRVPVQEAGAAYALLDACPDDHGQILLTY
jgi:2-desacetyl-2-hydroxyethyl bacteriochlorophyllide A dehydrogenase